MVPIAALGLLSHGELRVAGELVAHEDAASVAAERPGVVLGRAQVDAVEDLGAVGAEQRVFQFAVVLVAEEEAERVLGVVTRSTVTASDPQAHVDLEPLGAVRVDQLERCRTLPGALVATRVDVDPRCRIKEILCVRDDREGRQRLERVLELRAPRGAVHDVGVHPVVDDLTVE